MKLNTVTFADSAFICITAAALGGDAHLPLWQLNQLAAIFLFAAG